MRVVKDQQLKLGEMDISQIEIDLKSRDDIPQILRGLQHLYVNVDIREKLFQALEKIISVKTDKKNGRPGMELWKIFVLGVLRLSLNCDYDRLQSLANNYKTIRQMLGHGVLDEDYYYHLQTLKDNVRLLTSEVLSEINQIIVNAGHELLKKNETTKLAARCDSFVVKTDVHYPTDINLLFDAVRKAIELIAQLSDAHGLTSWRQYQYNVKTVKKFYRNAQQSKNKTKDDPKKLTKIQEAHQEYIDLATTFLGKVSQTMNYLGQNKSLSVADALN